MVKPGGVMDPTIPLFHWSPTKNRAQIIRYGLRPGVWDRARLWKPPYVCFSDYPGLAWELSGALHKEAMSWDLWQTGSWALNHWEIIPFDNGTLQRGKDVHVKEYRVYERVYKRDLWYVATRVVDEKGKVL